MPVERSAADVFAIPDFRKSASYLDAQLDSAFPACFYSLQSDGPRFSHDPKVQPFIKPNVVEHSPFFAWKCFDAPADSEAVAPKNKNVNKNAKANTDTNNGANETTYPNATLDRYDPLLRAGHPPAASLDSPTEPLPLAVDIWMGLVPKPTNSRRYKTWDSFLRPRESSSEQLPLFISEAGPAPYNTLLLKSSGLQDCLADRLMYCAALLAASVGRESAFFRRVGDSDVHLIPVYPNVRISGHSVDVLQSLQGVCVRSGDMFLSLRAFVKTSYQQLSASRCGIALASVVDKVLMLVEQTVSMDLDGSVPRSLLQLQATVRRISAVLTTFSHLVSKLAPGYSDEDVLELVFAQAGLANDESCDSRDVMQEVLRRVSQPWIEFIEEWIGTRREVGLPLRRDEPGRHRYFVKVEADVFLDSSGLEAREVDFQLDRESVPSFIPEDLARDILDVGCNLRFIRERHPTHILAAPDLATEPPRADWLFSWSVVREKERDITAYSKSLSRALFQANSLASDGLAERLNPLIKPAQSAEDNGLRIYGLDKAQIEANIAASLEKFDKPVTAIHGDFDANDRLVDTIQRQLRVGQSALGRSTLGMTPHWSLIPSLSFGGIVAAQAGVVNRESLRLLFKSHGLRSHLKLLRDFFLLGNGLFSAQLTHALFDPDMETAERKAGVVLQGGALMGLRLANRESDTWPPASSELRLALAGVLAETCAPLGDTTQTAAAAADPGSRNASLTGDGDLSFAVRELVPEDIDKCLDPDALEALDFLRLTYNPPASLASIIPPAILVQYDRVFKLLLRILRMLYVVGQMSRDVNSNSTRWRTSDKASTRLAFEATHFVSSVSSHMLGTGVATHWREFERILDRVESEIQTADQLHTASRGDSPGSRYSPDRLQTEHRRTLDRIVVSLLLRKRQRPVMKILEEIFGLILLFAKEARLFALGRHPRQNEGTDNRDMYRAFRQKVRLFLTVCQGMMDEGGQAATATTVNDLQSLKGTEEGGGGSGARGVLEGESLISQLVAKLDLGGYYSRASYS